MFSPASSKNRIKLGLSVLIICLALAVSTRLPVGGAEPPVSTEGSQPVSDHFDGTRYFNPGVRQSLQPAPGQEPRRSSYSWIWRWIFGSDWPEWPKSVDIPPGPPPVTRIQPGILRVTPVGHSTFLIQIDGLNILTDPIWSDRCSPVSWVGPKRHKKPGIRFEDLPPIDAVLVSHNHYDHLDLPTLKDLAKKGTPRCIVPLGNLDIVLDTGIPVVEELDWWQSVQISPDVTITLVPAQHFSSRTPWDRNKTLWGGFVVSGPSGRVYYSGDSGYGPHFREIARRFSPITVALLPISPFRPDQSKEPARGQSSTVHMGPAEAVRAHMDLSPQVSIAAHFQVFQLGPDDYDDAVNGLAGALREHDVKPDAFIALSPGQTEELDVHKSTVAVGESGCDSITLGLPVSTR